MSAVMTPSPPNSWHMLRALGGMGIFCGLLIALVFQATLPSIQRNRAAALEQAVFQVLPGAQNQTAFLLNKDGALSRLEPKTNSSEEKKAAEKTTTKNKTTADGQRLYAGYNSEGTLVGIAVEAIGQGFQENIRLIYGYDPVRQLVIGMAVLESRETPGLGDKIIKDSNFLANFAALDLSLNTTKDGLEHAVVAVKNGQKQQPWEIDGITGATVSSQAVAAIIDASAAQLAPALADQIDRLTGPETGKQGKDDG
jgi:Na+-translocating ferredoxin:NAD+ oxidoreductase subunit G